MRSRDKLGELFFDMLQEMYQASEPPLDFKEFRRKLEAGEIKCPKDWYRQHRLAESEYVVIRDNFYKKHKLTKRERGKFAWELLNYAPRFAEE